MDLYADGALVSTVEFATGQTECRFSGLPAGGSVVEIWPFQGPPIRLTGIELPSGADLQRAEDDRPRWITYGSSISHCRTAASPSFTWPGIVACARGLDLTSFGFGGQCHADPMIARLMRDRPARPPRVLPA